MKKKTRKTKEKLLSLLLTVAVLLTMQGIPVMAETVMPETNDAQVTVDTIGAAPSNPVHHCTKHDDGTDYTDWSYVYFGSYPQTEVTGENLTSVITGASYDVNGDAWINGTKYRRISISDTNDDYYFGNSEYRYFKWERIKWRVLNNNGSTLFVVADQGIDCKDYHDPGGSIPWENCALRYWLNNDFYSTAFSSSEQGAIVQQNVATEYENNTMDKVYLLSILEVINPDYGFCEGYNTASASRSMQTSDYAHARGAWKETSSVLYEGNCWWWLRSPGYSTIRAAIVSYDGDVYRDGTDVDISYDAVVPALHINLSSDLWSSVDDGTGGEGENGGTGGDSEDNPSNSSIQCQSTCSIEAGDVDYIMVRAYGNSKDELKTIVDSVTWESGDASVATVGKGSFEFSSSPTTMQSENGSYKVWYAIAFLPVTGIKAGSTTIAGRASDGSIASCTVKVQAKKMNDENTVGDGGSLTLGEDKTGKAGGSVSDFFPATWSLKSTVFPVEISKSTQTDGSYTIRGAVGIGKSDLLDDDAKWNKFKSNVSDAQKYTGRVDCLKSYRETWGVKSLTAVSTDKFQKLPELSVMGYFENTYDKNGNVISRTGKLAADASWSGSINWQFVTPIGPLYLNLDASGTLSGEIGPLYDYNAKKLQIVDGSLTLTPAVTLEGGYGISKVATIGAQGELSLPITMIPATKAEFEAKAALHLKVVFVIDYTHDLATYKTTLWDTTKAGKSGADAIGIELAEGTLSAMDTSFVSYAGAWNGSAIPDTIVENTGASETTEVMLQDGLLPSSLPMQAEIDGKTVMVFQSYDAKRDTLNSAKLMYSVCEDGTWSEPQPVWDNGCSDLYADMKVVGGKLVLAWQKEKAEITGDLETNQSDVMQAIAENSEISFAEFDSASGTFVNQTYVTDNDSYDMMPKICSQNDDIVISWVRNDAGDLMQESGVNTIYTSLWNGEAFDTESVLVESFGTIDDFVTYKDGTEVKAVYTGQTGEEKICAFYDENNQMIDALADLIHPAAEGLASGMHYINGKVNFISNGMLYSYDTTEKAAASYLAGDNTFGSTAQYCSNGEKGGYVWSVYDEETDTGKIVASMEEESGYSNPVTLYEKKGVIWRYVSPVIDSNGDWRIIANAMQTEEQAENHNSLFYVNPEINSGIELAGASIDEDDVKDGLTGVDYFAENTGDTTIQNLQLKITLPDGSTIQKEVPITILPGESVAETAYVDLSDIDQSQKVSISVYEEGQSNVEDCTVTNTVGQSDVAVMGTVKESDGEVTVTAELSNKSSIEAKTTLRLYSDENQTKELCLPQTETVKANNNSTVCFKVKKEDITYNENHAAYLTLKAEVEGGDYEESNNVSYVVLYKKETSDNGSSEKPSGDSSEKPSGGSSEKPAGDSSEKPAGDSSEKPAGDSSENTSGTTAENRKVNVKSIAIKSVSKRIAAGKKVTLAATVSPQNATNKKVTWKTSNSKYATVNSKGVVTTKKAGKGKTVTITAIAADGSGVKASVKLKLMKNAVTKVQIKNPPKSLNTGKSITLKTTVKTNGKDANKTLKWTTSNSKYATVNSKGKVTAKKAGKGKTVTITAVSTDGTNKKAKVKIKIK